MKNRFIRKILISFLVAITICILTINKSNAMDLNNIFNYGILNKIKEVLASVNNIDETKLNIKSSTNDSTEIQTNSIKENKVFYIGDSWMEDLREYEISESSRSYFFAENSRNADWVLDNYYDVNIPDDASCIVVEFGLNNYTYWDETQELAEKLANDYKNKEIFILRTPHVCSGYSYPSNFNSQVDIYNEHMRDYCKGKERITFIDPTITIVEDNGNGYLKDEYAADPYDTSLGGGKMHLSYRGYQTWYEDIIKCINAAVVEKTKLSEIRIKQAPSKTEYIEGENFDRSGMKIEAVYNNGTKKEITNYTVINENNLSLTQTSVTISYIEGDITKTVEQTIKVNKKVLKEVKIIKEPSKKEYEEGENFDKSGMKVEAIYNNGSKKEITDYKVSNGDNLKANQESVTITYIEDGVTKTVEQKIKVNKKETLKIESKTYEITEENNTKYIKKIIPNTNIENFKKQIETNGTIKIYINKEEINNKDNLITTGAEIIINFNNVETKYIAIVTGDLIGNGKIDNVNLLKLARFIAKIDLNLNGSFLKAADIYSDGKYGDINDLLKMARVLAKIEEL